MLNVLLHLGYGFIRATLSVPFRLGRGKRQFLESYGPEGLLPISPVARKLSADFERCLGCGLCELPIHHGSTRPQELASIWWRSPESWEAFRSWAHDLDGASLREAEATCPAAVPLTQMIAELKAVFRTKDGIERQRS